MYTNDACKDTVFIGVWYYIRNYCPEVIQAEACAHCGYFAVASCGAYEPTCTANFEGSDYTDNDPRNANLACPYQICRTAIVNNIFDNILYVQYGMEFLVGMQILICIATITYLLEYGQYYRTQEEVNACYSPENMQRGIYKKSTDLNDVIVRTDMLSSVIYPEASDDDDQPDEDGKYNHTYVDPSTLSGDRPARHSEGIRGGGTLVSPGNTPPGNRRLTTA